MQTVRLVVFGISYFFLLMSIALTGFYPPVFRAGANFLFQSFGSNRVAKFEPLHDPSGMLDTKVSVGINVRGQSVFPSSLGINSVREGYTPVALLVALILATPVAWRRRWRALALGLLIVQGFVLLRIIVALAYGFSRVGLGDRRLLAVGSLGSRILHRADQIVTGDLHLTFIAPVFIWLLVLVRPRDIAELIGGVGPSMVRPPG